MTTHQTHAFIEGRLPVSGHGLARQEIAQIQSHGLSRDIAVPRIQGQGFVDDGNETPGDATGGGPLIEGNPHAIGHLLQDMTGTRRHIIGRVPRQGVIDDHADAVEVAPLIRGLSRGLLWTHEGGRANGTTHARGIGRATVFTHGSQAKYRRTVTGSIVAGINDFG